MIIYNNKQSYQVFNNNLIPMGSLVFNPKTKQLSVLIDKQGANFHWGIS